MEILAFLAMSFAGFLILEITQNYVSEETKRLTCLYTPALIAFAPGFILNNKHRFALAFDRLLLTNNILHVNPRLSIAQAYRIGGKLMKQIKKAVGYNRRPACQYMKHDYPTLLQEVVQNIRTAAIEANSVNPAN